MYSSKNFQFQCSSDGLLAIKRMNISDVTKIPDFMDKKVNLPLRAKKSLQCL